MGTVLLWWAVAGVVFWIVVHMHMKTITWNWSREIPMAILCGPITICLLLVLTLVAMPVFWVVDKCAAWLEE